MADARSTGGTAPVRSSAGGSGLAEALLLFSLLAGLLGMLISGVSSIMHS
jgi:hypothetical protein